MPWPSVVDLFFPPLFFFNNRIRIKEEEERLIDNGAKSRKVLGGASGNGA